MAVLNARHVCKRRMCLFANSEREEEEEGEEECCSV